MSTLGVWPDLLVKSVITHPIVDEWFNFVTLMPRPVEFLENIQYLKHQTVNAKCLLYTMHYVSHKFVIMTDGFLIITGFWSRRIAVTHSQNFSLSLSLSPPLDPASPSLSLPFSVSHTQTQCTNTADEHVLTLVANIQFKVLDRMQ